MVSQSSLFSYSQNSEIRLESFHGMKRFYLDEDAWVDYIPSYVLGYRDLANQIYQNLEWKIVERTMYDRVIKIPRLMAHVPLDGHLSFINQFASMFSQHYKINVQYSHANFYRDKNDSIAFHRDQCEGHKRTHVAILAFGARRRFVVRSIMDKDKKLSFESGFGDLLIMGGSLQERYEHGIAKAQSEGPRMSIMFREHLDRWDR
jgi:alkylated DNA repair dioxygenase AlkB